jgi:hypothetical protein
MCTLVLLSDQNPISQINTSFVVNNFLICFMKYKKKKMLKLTQFSLRKCKDLFVTRQTSLSSKAKSFQQIKHFTVESQEVIETIRPSTATIEKEGTTMKQFFDLCKDFFLKISYF